MACTLKINGSTVDRPAARVVIDRLTLAVGEGYDVLEFSEVAAGFPAGYRKAWSVELVDDDLGTLFRGRLVSRHYLNVGRGPVRIGYRAFGLEWVANLIRVTAPDGTGRIQYNMPRTDDDYTPGSVGLSVGAMLKRLFDLHATALAAVGVTGYDEAELEALTVVPPEPVPLAGGLIQCARSLIEQWCNKYALWVDNADGKIRVANQLTDLTPLTLTHDDDPFLLDSLSEDTSECASQVVMRGGPDVQAAYLDFADELLGYGWTPGDPWTYRDYLAPGDSADVGAVTAQSSDTLTIQSDAGGKSWAANYWNGIQAEVVAYNPAASGIEFSESRRITACTALTAGGTSVLTVDAPWNNTGYTRYSIRGLFSPAASVWRKVLINQEYVAQHLVKRFSHSVPWAPVDGAVTQTTSPQASICYSPGCVQPWLQWPATFDVVLYDGETDGYIMFHEPIVKPFSSQASLDAGTPDGVPCDVKVLVPYSRGALTAAAPSSGYEGTSYTTDELERTLYYDVPDWVDYRDATLMAQLAREVLDTVKNTVCEGSLTYFGKLEEVLAKGVALNLTGSGYTTGFEGMNALVRGVVLDFAPDGGSAVPWQTSVTFSNRLKPFSGDRLYRHPAFGGARALADAALDMRGGAAMVNAAAAASSFRPDEGYQGSLDVGPAGRNTYKGPRKETGLSAGDLRGALGKDEARNAMEADDRESRRRVAERGSQRAWTDLSGALGGLEERNAVEADDRENRRLAAGSASGRDASRLSHALGNPTGPAPKDATPAQLARHESDRAIDAELARIAGDGDEPTPSTSGPGLSYR